MYQLHVRSVHIFCFSCFMEHEICQRLFSFGKNNLRCSFGHPNFGVTTSQTQRNSPTERKTTVRHMMFRTREICKFLFLHNMRTVCQKLDERQPYLQPYEKRRKSEWLRCPTDKRKGRIQSFIQSDSPSVSVWSWSCKVETDTLNDVA